MNAYEQMRANGKRVVGNRTYARQKLILSPNLVNGKLTWVSFSFDYTVRGKFAVIPAGFLQPSHIGGAENPLHFIPEAQPRNRATSVSGQVVPEIIAQNLQPNQLLHSGTAYSGAPVVNLFGEVIQGNGRAISLITYYKLFADDPAGYVKAIVNDCACFGFTRNAIERIKAMTDPVLVRILDTTDNEAIKLGQFTQSDLEAVATKATQIKSKANRIDDSIKTVLVNELLAADDGSRSLGELIRGSRVFKVLISRGVIRADELENYTNSRGEVNADGIKFVSDLLLNLVFQGSDVNTPDVFRNLPANVQAAIEKSTLYLTKIPDEYSINQEVSESILSTREFLESGYNDIPSWTKQVDFFTFKTPAEIYSKLALKLTEIYTTTRTQREIIEKFRYYFLETTPQPNSLF